MGATLFIAEETGTCRVVLRRYRHRAEGADHLCNASVVVHENARATPRREDGVRQVSRRRFRPTNPRWPAACEECGATFGEDDPRQVLELEWYEGGGHRFVWGVGSRDGPAGAMIRSRWRDVDGRPEAWAVFLPNGTVWNTNDRASGEGGNYWTVTGSAPRISVTPSIDDRGSRPWHGFITDGVCTP